MIEGVVLTPLSVISTEGGDVLHAIKSSDQSFGGFGEAYFSKIKYNTIKGWKRHKEMILNLIVPVGAVRFVLYDDRPRSSSQGQFQEIMLSSVDHYQRITVPPMVWVGFQGQDKKTSIILNIASIEHLPEEVERRELGAIKYNWEKFK
jgi:dTDP-4-dehydrorhamnose 3,5-epimerase